MKRGPDVQGFNPVKECGLARHLLAEGADSIFRQLLGGQRLAAPSEAEAVQHAEDRSALGVGPLGLIDLLDLTAACSIRKCKRADARLGGSAGMQAIVGGPFVVAAIRGCRSLSSSARQRSRHPSAVRCIPPCVFASRSRRLAAGDRMRARFPGNLSLGA